MTEAVICGLVLYESSFVLLWESVMVFLPSLGGSCQIWLARWRGREGFDMAEVFFNDLHLVSFVRLFVVSIALTTGGGFVAFAFGFH